MYHNTIPTIWDDTHVPMFCRYRDIEHWVRLSKLSTQGKKNWSQSKEVVITNWPLWFSFPKMHLTICYACKQENCFSWKNLVIYRGKIIKTGPLSAQYWSYAILIREWNIACFMYFQVCLLSFGLNLDARALEEK